MIVRVFGRTEPRSLITLLLFDVCGFFLECRTRLPCACGSEYQSQCPRSSMQEFHLDEDQRPNK